MCIEFTIEFIDRWTSIAGVLQPLGGGGYVVKRPTLTVIPGGTFRLSAQEPRNNTDAVNLEVHLKRTVFKR